MRIALLWVAFGALALAAFESIGSFRSEFVQTIRSEDGKIIEYRGRVYAKSPYYGLWKYEKPMEKEIYIVDKQVVIYEPALEQATVSSLQNSIDFMALLRESKRNSEGIYEATVFEQKYQILADEKGEPQKVFFIDKLHNEVQIIFKNAEINPVLEKEMFLFMPSGEIDLIRQ
ncbi:LolA-like outer membrane lipoprotein chaperone [Wolinella succinogenes]|uniref:LolA-like outer membrane lipoprotein chaperone n=1 Tax=Wolinella succinogenes TaxID=844 RepID=UPI00240A9106|nr:LolA-like outer membrane lipoprotein chaperone [Wolinella succinogenes]